MMTFQLTADPDKDLQLIAFELVNDGLSAHYQWQLVLRCQQSPVHWLRQWGRVTVRNWSGQRHWHGCVIRQSDYGCCQGWHYWLIVLASPLAVLARWVTSRTWVQASAVSILQQTFEQVGWRKGVDFLIAVDNPTTTLPVVVRYNESSLSLVDRLCTQCGWVFYFQQTAHHWCLHLVEHLPNQSVQGLVAQETGLVRMQPTLIHVRHQYVWHVDHGHWQQCHAAQPGQPLQYTSVNQSQWPGYQTSQWITEHPPVATLWQQQLDWQRHLLSATSDAVQWAPGQCIQLLEDDNVSDYRVLQLTAKGEWFSCFHAGDCLPEALARQWAGWGTLDTGFWPRLILYPAACDYRKPNEWTACHKEAVEKHGTSDLTVFPNPKHAPAECPALCPPTEWEQVDCWGCRIQPPLPNTLLTQTITRHTRAPVLSDKGHYYVRWLFEKNEPQVPTWVLPMAHVNQFHWPHYPGTTLMVHCFAHELTPRFCIVGALPSQTVSDVLISHTVTPACARAYNQMTWRIDKVAMRWRDEARRVEWVLPTCDQDEVVMRANQGTISFISDLHGQLGCDLNFMAHAARIRCRAGQHQYWCTQEKGIEFHAERQLRLQAGLDVWGFAKEMLFVTVNQRCHWRASGNVQWSARQTLTVLDAKTIELTYQTNAHWNAEQQGISLVECLGRVRINPQSIELGGHTIDFNAGIIYLYAG